MRQQYLALWLAVALLLAGFGLRLFAIDTFPLFIDETLHIVNADIIVRDASPLYQVWLGRQFTIGWYALFQPAAAAPAFVARAATLLAVLVGAASLLKLSWRFGGPRAMLLAGILYTLSAFHLFFDRLALADNIAGAAVLLAVLAASALRRRIHWRDAVVTGLLLFIAFGAKSSTLPYYGIPLAAAIALPRRGTPFAKAFGWFVTATSVAVGLTLVYAGVVAVRGMDLLSNSLGYALTNRGGAGAESILSLERIAANASATYDAIAPYIGPFVWPLLVVVVLVGLLLPRTRYLSLVGLAPVVALWLGQPQESRYLVTALMLVFAVYAVLASMMLSQLPAAMRGPLVLLLAVYMAVMASDAAAGTGIAFGPRGRDYAQYVLSDASGFNLREAAAVIEARGDASLVIGGLANCEALRLMTLGRLPVRCPGIAPTDAAAAGFLAQVEAARGAGSYLVLEANPYIPQDVPGTALTVIDRPAARPPLTVYSLAP